MGSDYYDSDDDDNKSVGSYASSYRSKGSYASSYKSKGSYASSNKSKSTYASSNKSKGSYASSYKSKGSYASSYKSGGSYVSSYKSKGSYASSTKSAGSYVSDNDNDSDNDARSDWSEATNVSIDEDSILPMSAEAARAMDDAVGNMRMCNELFRSWNAEMKQYVPVTECRCRTQANSFSI